MANETLEDLTNITFPKSVDEKGAYRILEFVSGNICYRISYGSFSGFYMIEDGKLKKKYEADIGGTITSNDFGKRATFEFLRGGALGSFSGIRFSTIPGYDLKEHDDGEVQAWNEIRESVENYFKAVKEIKSSD